MSKSKQFGKIAMSVILALSMIVTAMFTTFTAFAEGKYYTDFASYEEELEYAGRLNREIFADSVVLMKNENEALPLDISTESNVSVVGMLSYNTITGGTGSGAGNASGFVSIENSLQSVGFNLNKKVADIYKRTTCQAPVSMGFFVSNTTVEAPSSIMDVAKGSFDFYGDAVVWTIGRVGGEGQDLLSYNLPTNTDKTKHILELDDNERDVLAYLEGLKQGGAVKKIIVLLNTANVFEMGVLEDNENVDAILWIGQPGSAGLGGLGEVLTGAIAPSGRTVDIWNANHKNDPTWMNNGNPGQNGIDPDTGKEYTTTAFRKDGDSYVAITGRPSRARLEETGKTIEYEEGIYLGYKYYETAAAENVLTDPRVGYNAIEGTVPARYDGDVYYNRSTGVIYPFGYGLSYTSFTQTFVTTATELESAVNAKNGLDDKVTVSVEVKNVGSVAGKEVVQLYVHAPYTAGGIEKAEVSLVSYAKTKLLQPGEKQVVTMEVRIGDIASFDYNDANSNDWFGYEIEAGAYEFRLQKNSHEEIASLDVTLTAKTESLDNDSDATNNTPFSNGDDFDTLLNIKDKTTGEVNTPDGVDSYTISGEVGGKMVIMSRANMAGTFPTPPSASTVLYGKKCIELLYSYDVSAENATDTSRYNAYADSRSDKTTDPWYKTESDIPASWTQGAGTLSGGKYALQLKNMVGLPYTDAQWVTFMNQFTYDELVSVISSSGSPAIDSVGKSTLKAADGPGQLSRGTFWCCAVNIGSTWDTTLAEKQGTAIGNEALYMGITGWWGPGVNIHRSPFGGRNFEYYSQDSLQEGLMVASVVKGYQSKGGIAYLKHFAVDDMENVRYGCGTFVDEQTIREIYLKAFEYGVKDGGAGAMMASHNRLGCIQNYGNYALTTAVAVNEWGFGGYLQTDMYVGYSRSYSVLRSGVSILMGSMSGNNKVSGTWDATVTRADGGKGAVRDGAAGEDGVVPVSYTQWYWVRNAAQRLLYVQANSSVTANGVDLSDFTDKTFDGTQNVAFDGSVAVDLSAINASSVSYKLNGTLPNGLVLDENTGKISGTPTESGTFKVNVGVVADGWITKTVTVTLQIKPTLSVDVITEQPTLGEDFEATVTNNIQGFTVVEESGITAAGTYYVSASYSAEGLPAGLSIDAATGKIVGTPTVSGTFTVSVKLNYTLAKASMGWGNRLNIRKTEGSYVSEVVLNVVGDSSDGDATVSYEDFKAAQDKLDSLQNDMNGLQDKLTALEEAVKSLNEDKKSGCNATVGTSVTALVVVVAAIVAACFMAVKSKQKKG